MAVDPLAILFGSPTRLKLLRFFLFNPSKEFSFDDISRRARLVRRTARTEMDALLRAGVIKKKVFFELAPKAGKKVRVSGLALDKTFPELPALQTFLFETAPLDGKNVIRHLRKAGTLDVVVATGVFMRNFEQRLDLLIAMKKLSESKVETAVRSLESELGIEIRFAAMETEDLIYRVGMHDRLTRDVFDYPHDLLVDKIDIRNEIHRP